MFRVQTTTEYQKCLAGLLTRGKIGKEVYRTARVAEAEANEGHIRTVPRTHHGENRLPDAQKYDLPGDYRLVVQFRRSKEPVTVFRFVGFHEETECWLVNRRGESGQPKRQAEPIPDTNEQLENEKRRREREQQEWEELVGILEKEKEQLNNDLSDRDRSILEQAAGVEELEEKQKQLEQENKQLARERDAMVVRQEQLAKEKDESISAAKLAAERELAAKMKSLQESQKRQEENRKQLALYRERQIGFQQQVEGEKENLRKQLQLRESQMQMFGTQVRRLQKQLNEAPVAEPLIDDKFWLWAFLIAAGVILVLVVIISIISQLRPSLVPSPRPDQGGGTPNAQKPPGEPAKTAPAEGRANPPQPPQAELRVEKTPSGSAATERQMAYVDGLVRRKGWSEKERDAEINKVLGYVRSYQNLTKKEASSLIDAWK